MSKLFTATAVFVAIGAAYGITRIVPIDTFEKLFGSNDDVWTKGAPPFKSYGYVPPVADAKVFVDRYPDAGFGAEWLRPTLEAYAKNRLVPSVSNRTAKSDKEIISPSSKQDDAIKAEGE